MSKTVLQVSLGFPALQKLNALSKGVTKRGSISKLVESIILNHGFFNLDGMSDLDLLDLRADIDSVLKSRIPGSKVVS